MIFVQVPSMMIVTPVMMTCSVICATCILFIILSLHLATRNVAPSNYTLKATRVQISIDNSSHVSRNKTKTTQRPVVQDSYLATSSTTKENLTETRDSSGTESPPVPVILTKAEVAPAGPTLDLNQTVKIVTDA